MRTIYENELVDREMVDFSRNPETDILDYADLDYAQTLKALPCITPGNPYVLHCFPAHKTDLTALHHEHLDRIADKIVRSFRGSRPIKKVKIVGHAATWKNISQAEYGRRALARAENAKTQMHERLAIAGISDKVAIQITHQANTQPLVENLVNSSSLVARNNRALNRRVELFWVPAKPKKTPGKRKPGKKTVRIIRRCCKEKHRDLLKVHIERAVKASRLAQKRFQSLAAMSKTAREKAWNQGPEKVWFGTYRRGRRKTPFHYVKKTIDRIRHIFLSKHPSLIVQCYYRNDAPNLSWQDCEGCKDGLACVNEKFNPHIDAFTLGFTCTCTKRDHLNPMNNLPEPPPYAIFLTNLWFYRPKGIPMAVWAQNRETTIAHEVAHLAGARRLFAERVGKPESKRLARRNAWGARVNADNYAYYLMTFVSS